MAWRQLILLAILNFFFNRVHISTFPLNNVTGIRENNIENTMSDDDIRITTHKIEHIIGNDTNDCIDESIECKVDQSNNTNTPSTHTPLFGFIPRECPLDRLPELFPVRKCNSDEECWPRICCFDENEVTGFCRSSIPTWDKLRMPRIASPLKTAMAYWQCTPPPPPTYDLFPKTCRSTLDCFPNLCCQEKDMKVCRPPKRSILTLISNIAQRENWFG